MAFATGEVIPTPGCDAPFKVAFTIRDKIVSEWPVESQEEGEHQIVTVLRGLGKLAESEGFI